MEDRDLWVLEITAKPGRHTPGIPEFKYVANMHGDEVVGKEMLLLLTKYMCEKYLDDDRITRLVNGTRMHFLYSMNPDGYEMASKYQQKHQQNFGKLKMKDSPGRLNANGVDLNRNFPDQYGTDQLNRINEPEVKAVMNWTKSIPFVLSANLHGGSLVANYPYDDSPEDYANTNSNVKILESRQRNSAIQHKKNPTDDHELFQHLATVYSKAHPTMHFGNPCVEFQDEHFPGGITNGAEWYSVTGGMQDWNYVRAQVMEITIEMGCDKFPNASQLLSLWNDHREPMILFIEQIHHNVHGFVRSSIGTLIPRAAIIFDHSHHTVYSTQYGDYFRLSLPGRHNITIVADG